MNTGVPSLITKDFLEKYKKLHIEKYNVYLTDEEATRDATHFMNLMKVVTRKLKSRNK